MTFNRLCGLVELEKVIWTQDILRQSEPLITSHDERSHQTKSIKTLQREAGPSGNCDFIWERLMMLSRPNHGRPSHSLCRVFGLAQISSCNMSLYHVSTSKPDRCKPRSKRVGEGQCDKPGGAIDVPPSGQTRHGWGQRELAGGQSAYWP